MIINKFCIPDIQSYTSKLENIIMTTTITTADTSSLRRWPKLDSNNCRPIYNSSTHKKKAFVCNQSGKVMDEDCNTNEDE